MKTKRAESKGGKDARQVAAQVEALGYIVPGSKVLIMRDLVQEQVSDGGIILREDAQQHPLKGTIIGLGLGIIKDPATYDLDGINVLMRATFSKYEGHKENITLLNGDTAQVEFLTAADLYLIWVDSGLEQSEIDDSEEVVE